MFVVKNVNQTYHVILIVYKTYTLSVVGEPLTSLAPFLLLHVHCCTDFCLKKKIKKRRVREKTIKKKQEKLKKLL